MENNNLARVKSGEDETDRGAGREILDGEESCEESAEFACERCRGGRQIEVAAIDTYVISDSESWLRSMRVRLCVHLCVDRCKIHLSGLKSMILFKS